MTYLATEMLLYLLSAAAIGMVLGGLIWGGGKRRQMRALRADLMTRLESQKAAHEKTRLSLERADVRMQEAVEAAKADAKRLIGELQRAVEGERRKADEARTDLEELRARTEKEDQEGRASSQAALTAAMRAADVEKAAAAQALAREAQARAHMEELRLLIGAEKLAVENARTELDKARIGWEETRAEMQAAFEAERTAHEQAKRALDDIRSTLSKTFGPEAFGMAAANGSAVDADPERPAPLQARGHNLTALPLVMDMAAAGEALNYPDHDEADIEDREDMSLELVSSFDTEPDATLYLEPEEVVEVAEPADSEAEIREIGAGRAERQGPEAPARPEGFLDQAPDQADDLKAIEGIGEGIERRLNDQGCYQYRQLADLTAKDIDWLSAAIDVTPSQIAADRWVQQAKRLEGGAEDDATFEGGTADRKNAAG